MANDYIEAARAYHEITKHSYTSVRSGGHSLDWDSKPLAYKIYPETAALLLPRDLNLSAMPALSALSSDATAGSAAPLGLDTLTRILFCADGLTRRKRVGNEDYHFRAAPSAGALYPIELYLAAGEVDGLEPGLYHFSPADLKLRGLRRGDVRAILARASAHRPSIVHARAALVLTSIFWRSAWKYRARAYRYCFWDAGTMLANLFAAASADGIPAAAVTAFQDAPVETLLGVDSDREGVIAIVPLGSGVGEPAPPPEITPLPFESIALSEREVVYDDIVKMHRESRLVTDAEVRAVSDAVLQAPEPSASSAALKFDTVAPEDAMRLGETILRRGSTRTFAREAIPAEELATILAASSAHPHVDFPRLTDTYLIVNAIDGMQPGAYYYARDARAFELLKAGDFRGEAGYLCLEQPLGMDCSALLVYMADLERALGALGNRGYRDAHLEAGVLGGRAYLAAYALDRGATGLTFYDDDTTRFFEPHAAGKSPLLMVALGVPLSHTA
ncbi:MAG TPA: SagB/ThcOx family dehydrogenase [Candidatus Binataceae bacterium]